MNISATFWHLHARRSQKNSPNNAILDNFFLMVTLNFLGKMLKMQEDAENANGASLFYGRRRPVVKNCSVW